MIYPYLRLPGSPDPTTRPYIPIQLSYQNKRTPAIYFLVDSGADYTYADYHIALWLGVDLARAKRTTSYTANNQSFISYSSPINIILGNNAMELPVLFTKQFSGVGVLGQEGFFDRFSITFERYKRKITVVAR
jgi:hypothetical protein